ncbi:galactokinase [Naumannella halotolerans]|uniref:galactokinase n=1 Tax=Naumannella halotolerans TaxID=993414 RepID=UPI00370D37C6
MSCPKPSPNVCAAWPHRPESIMAEPTFGTGPSTGGSWSAPGRVNLIGEHTDYNNGLALPIAIGQRTTVEAVPADDGVYRVSSAGHGQEVIFGPQTQPGEVTGWAAYVAGTVWALGELGVPLVPGSFTISSEVPTGAGLSSSAALECAVACAVLGLAGRGLDRHSLATATQRAENVYVGAPTGGMDQLASAFGRAGSALLVDVGADSLEQVPFELTESGLELLVIDTGSSHSHADGEYGARRRSCEQAAAALGVASLRDVQDAPLAETLASLAGLDDGTIARRVRHVSTENARVERTVALLREKRITEIGPLLLASHESLRDDYEVTVPVLDLAVDAAMASGSLGARMTGGGFGGSVIALVDAGLSESVAEGVSAAFVDAGHAAPTTRSVVPADGAGPLLPDTTP